MAERPDVAARERARALLHRSLDEEQRRDLERYDGFRVRQQGRMYWVRVGGAPVCWDFASRKLLRFCVAPDRLGGMPPEDIALTFLFWLTADSTGFNRRAVMIESNPFPRRRTEQHLIDLLVRHASARLPSTHPAVQRLNGARPSWRNHGMQTPMQQNRPPTEEERVRTRRYTREIMLQLRVRQLRETFAESPSLDERVLERLAEEWLTPRTADASA